MTTSTAIGAGTAIVRMTVPEMRSKLHPIRGGISMLSMLLCKPIVIKQGAWIGAGASIMAGVTIGKYAIVGAASVVTHDVGDYDVVVGSPARIGGVYGTKEIGIRFDRMQG